MTLQYFKELQKWSLRKAWANEAPTRAELRGIRPLEEYDVLEETL